MTPTEAEATAAVDAAARALYEQRRPLHSFDAMHALDQNDWRAEVLPIVWAALEALPDRRAAAWDEGHRFTGFEPGRGENPYRAEVTS